METIYKKNYMEINKNEKVSILMDIVTWIKNYAIEHNVNLVVGISGGIDSAVVSTLSALTNLDTYVVSLPINQNKGQLERADKHIEWLKSKFSNVKRLDFDISDIYKIFFNKFPAPFNNSLSFANSKSRLRMVCLYHISTNINGIVVGTGNKVEDFGIGFFTKYGDGGVDISPIADFTKTEVRNLAKDLGIIEDIILAKPTDGLWDDDRCDEDQIGATYEELEWAMDFCGDQTVLSNREREVYDIFSKLNKKNRHKMVSIPIYKKK